MSFVGVAGVAGAVIAAPVENAPGSACVAAGAGSLSVRTDGDIENVIDQHPTLNVCCRVASKNPSGALELGTIAPSSGGQSSRLVTYRNTQE